MTFKVIVKLKFDFLSLKMIFLRKYKLYIRPNISKPFVNDVWCINDLIIIYRKHTVLEFYYDRGYVGVGRHYNQLRYYVEISSKNKVVFSLSIDFIVPEIKIDSDCICNRNICELTINTPYDTMKFKNFKCLNGYLSYDVQGNRKVKI